MLFLLINKPKHRKPSDDFLFKELKLTEIQLDEAFIFKEEHHQKMRRIDRRKRRLKNEFFTSFSKDINNINSDSIADEIGLVEARKDKEVLSYFKKIRSICTDKQKNKFDKIILKALPKEGKRPPRRH